MASDYPGPSRTYSRISSKSLTSSSLEALVTEMRRNATDFVQSDIDTVLAQAALIPAVRLNAQAMDDIKTLLIAFYTTPNDGTYNAMRDVYILFNNVSIRDGGQPIFRATNDSYGKVLYGLNHALGAKVVIDAITQNVVNNLTRDQQRRLVGLR